MLLCFVSFQSLAWGSSSSRLGHSPGSISGTVTDVDDAVIPAAAVTVDGPSSSAHRTLQTDEAGSFELKDLDPAVPYKITVSARNFAAWTSPAVVLGPGQALALPDIKLKISVVETTVVALMVEQLATQQVKAEEKQRVLGIIPNFFVVYDKNAVPLTKKLKYESLFEPPPIQSVSPATSSSQGLIRQLAGPTISRVQRVLVSASGPPMPVASPIL